MEKGIGLLSVDRGASGHEKCSQCEKGQPTHRFIADLGEGFREFEAVCL